MQIVLASQSPYRKMQLTQFGLRFTAVSPKANETELKASGPKEPIALAEFLALNKAQSLQAEFPDALIIGSDQMVEFNGERLDKPGSTEAAIQQLHKLSGQVHQLITSVAVIWDKRPAAVATEVSRVKLRALTDSLIRAYAHLDNPYDCAGAYKIEKGGMGLVEHIETKDPSAIQGLPLIGLTSCLLSFDITLDQIWGPN